MASGLSVAVDTQVRSRRENDTLFQLPGSKQAEGALVGREEWQSSETINMGRGSVRDSGTDGAHCEIGGTKGSSAVPCQIPLVHSILQSA